MEQNATKSRGAVYLTYPKLKEEEEIKHINFSLKITIYTILLENAHTLLYSWTRKDDHAK